MTITGRDGEFTQTITALYQLELGREPEPAGLAAWLEQARHGMTGDQIRAALHDSAEGIAYRARPVLPPLPSLTMRGIDFVDDAGLRIVLNGTDQFCADRRFLDGDDLEPLFTESRELGFNLWRVFLMGSIAQNTILELRPSDRGYYEGLRPFADLLNSHGIVLLATVFVDNQDIKAGAAHWSMVADRLRGSGTLLSAGNQWPKNGWSPDNLSDPGMRWSRGSGLEDQKVDSRGASFAEFHPRRDLPASLLDSVASPVTLYHEGLDVPLIISEPIGFAEEARPGRRSDDPRLAWRLGRHYATECAGAVFHSDAGMRCELMGQVTRACAAAWTKGMQI